MPEGLNKRDEVRVDQRLPENSIIQPVEPASKAEFDEALKTKGQGTNIYGWDGEVPKPGFYRQGNTLIEIFVEPNESGVIGYAV